MRYMLELMEHNGVAGKNAVDPFAGSTRELTTEYFNGHEPSELMTSGATTSEDGRIFTYSHTIKLPDQTNFLFREKVQGEPSDWAKAQAND
jgi:hypothetical protein